MTIFFICAFFLIGLIFGSFFNVVGLRLPLKQPFTKGRSSCPHCDKPLKPYQLIPVMSFLCQRGKCQFCKTPISMIYPLTELFTGCLFSLSYFIIGSHIELMVALSMISLLMIIFVTDLTYMIIPNKVLLFFLPLFILLRIIEPLTPWYSSLVGAILGLGVMMIIIVISRGGMGAGDMKLFGVLGIVLGVKHILLAFFLATMIGALISIGLLILNKINRKQMIPFGPFIVTGTIIAYFFGHDLLSWYMNLLI